LDHADDDEDDDRRSNGSDDGEAPDDTQGRGVVSHVYLPANRGTCSFIFLLVGLILYAQQRGGIPQLLWN
jgi:hypothetical protein